MWLLNPYRFAAAYTPTDANAAAYIAAVEAADGQTLEAGVRQAIDAFVIGCKADGIWNAIKASCILSGARTLAGALVPLVGTAPTNVNFVSGDYNRKTGLVGNGSTKYLDSNRNNNADPQNSKHMSAHVTTTPTVASCLIGARQGQTQDQGSSQIIHVDSVGSNFRINSAAVNSDGQGIGVGLAAASRSSSTVGTWRHSASRSGSISTTSEAPHSINIHVFQRSGSLGNAPTNARLAFYSIGESLDLALLDARVTTLVAAFAAAIP
jgi:hypothetical protein